MLRTGQIQQLSVAAKCSQETWPVLRTGQIQQLSVTAECSQKTVCTENRTDTATVCHCRVQPGDLACTENRTDTATVCHCNVQPGDLACTENRTETATVCHCKVQPGDFACTENRTDIANRGWLPVVRNVICCFLPAVPGIRFVKHIVLTATLIATDNRLHTHVLRQNCSTFVPVFDAAFLQCLLDKHIYISVHMHICVCTGVFTEPCFGITEPSHIPGQQWNCRTDRHGSRHS